MEIHQFVHTLTYGDAISGEALAIRRLLRAKGVASEIYCIHRHDKVADFCKSWTKFAGDLAAAQNAGTAVTVLLHYSIASPLNQLLLDCEGITRGLIYHNLTPVHWFTRYNDRVTRDLICGRDELPDLLRHVDIVLADSTYNMEELSAMGCARAEVLPLLLDAAKWNVAANGGIAANLHSLGEKNILHVGRMAPNKCIEDCIKAFYFYHHKIEKKSRLWLIGSDIDTEIYSFELRRLVEDLRLKEAVTFVGTVSDCELRAFYENSALYLCMSEHEGFCVPLLEAMHFGLPIIAYDACAVAETLSDAGLLIRKKAPAELAELMHVVLTDTTLRQGLVEKGQRQVARFSESAFSSTLERILLQAPNAGNLPKAIAASK